MYRKILKIFQKKLQNFRIDLKCVTRKYKRIEKKIVGDQYISFQALEDFGTQAKQFMENIEWDELMIELYSEWVTIVKSQLDRASEEKAIPFTGQGYARSSHESGLRPL